MYFILHAQSIPGVMKTRSKKSVLVSLAMYSTLASVSRHIPKKPKLKEVINRKRGLISERRREKKISY